MSLDGPRQRERRAGGPAGPAKCRSSTTHTSGRSAASARIRWTQAACSASLSRDGAPGGGSSCLRSAARPGASDGATARYGARRLRQVPGAEAAEERVRDRAQPPGGRMGAVEDVGISHLREPARQASTSRLFPIPASPSSRTVLPSPSRARLHAFAQRGRGPPPGRRAASPGARAPAGTCRRLPRDVPLALAPPGRLLAVFQDLPKRRGRRDACRRAPSRAASPRAPRGTRETSGHLLGAAGAARARGARASLRRSRPRGTGSRPWPARRAGRRARRGPRRARPRRLRTARARRSGAIPRTAPPASGRATRARARATPRSMIRTRWSSVISTFSGLRSRWTMPAAWMAARPAATWSAISRSSASGTVPSSRPRARSVLPRTYSMTRKWTVRPPTASRLGAQGAHDVLVPDACGRPAPRAGTAGRTPRVPRRCGWTTLSATSRPSVAPREVDGAHAARGPAPARRGTRRCRSGRSSARPAPSPNEPSINSRASTCARNSSARSGCSRRTCSRSRGSPSCSRSCSSPRMSAMRSRLGIRYPAQRAQRLAEPTHGTAVELLRGLRASAACGPPPPLRPRRSSRARRKHLAVVLGERWPWLRAPGPRARPGSPPG